MKAGTSLFRLVLPAPPQSRPGPQGILVEISRTKAGACHQSRLKAQRRVSGLLNLHFPHSSRIFHVDRFPAAFHLL